MKKINFVLCIVLILNVTLFPKISSKVEGTIVDELSNVPISNVEVTLIQFSSKSNNKIWEHKTISDINGRFVFDSEKIDLLTSSNFINLIQCTHEEYVNLYFGILEKLTFNDRENLINSFILKEGEIKHLKIKLTKGGRVEGILKYNDGTDIKPLANHIFSLNRNVNGHAIKYAEIKTDDNGNYYKSAIPTGDEYYLSLFLNGYTMKKSSQFSMLSGGVKRVDHIIDLSNKTGIRGNITIAGNVPNNGINVTLSKIDNIDECDNCFCNFHSKLSEYYCYNLQPGEYKISVSAINELEIYKRNFTFEIKPNQTIEYNIDFLESDKN